MPTVAIGLTRLLSILTPFYGIVFVLPSALRDASAAWWMPPAIFAVSFIPLLGTLAFSGYVNAINVNLPQLARRSKDHLMGFASRVPPETRVEIKCMWFLPWPKTTVVYFGDLKRLPHSSIRLSNLEHIPYHSEEAHRKQPVVSWAARVLYGRYWVSRSYIKDRSRAPGAWDRMWEQIPLVGKERKTMNSRSTATNSRVREDDEPHQERGMRKPPLHLLHRSR